MWEGPQRPNGRSASFLLGMLRPDSLSSETYPRVVIFLAPPTNNKATQESSRTNNAPAHYRRSVFRPDRGAQRDHLQGRQFVLPQRRGPEGPHPGDHRPLVE